MFDNILAQGYDATVLIEALKEDVRNGKLNSIRDNRLSFFPISSNYLEKGYWQASLSNQADAEPHINRSRIV